MSELDELQEANAGEKSIDSTPVFNVEESVRDELLVTTGTDQGEVGTVHDLEEQVGTVREGNTAQGGIEGQNEWLANNLEDAINLPAIMKKMESRGIENGFGNFTISGQGSTYPFTIQYTYSPPRDPRINPHAVSYAQTLDIVIQNTQQQFKLTAGYNSGHITFQFGNSGHLQGKGFYSALLTPLLEHAKRSSTRVTEENTDLLCEAASDYDVNAEAMPHSLLVARSPIAASRAHAHLVWAEGSSGSFDIESVQAPPELIELFRTVAQWEKDNPHNTTVPAGVIDQLEQHVNQLDDTEDEELKTVLNTQIDYLENIDDYAELRAYLAS